LLDAHGGSDRLQVRDDVQPPRPGPGELLVRVRAAAVNPADCKLRRGEVPFFLRPRLPCIPGHDIAGDVVVGGGKFRLGDPVFGLLPLSRMGGYAELALLAESGAARMPDSLSYEEAAAVPVCGLTSLQALRDAGRLSAGQSVLIHGAAGGVGTFAVQIARALGAEVAATCGREGGEIVRSLGVTTVIDYTIEDFTRRGARYDVIFDAVGRRSFRDCRRALEPHGTYVSTLPTPSLLMRMALRPALRLFGWKNRVQFVLARGRAADLEFLATLADEGKLRPRIERVYPLDQVRAAHDHVDTGHAHGKTVLRIA
jgi:NADPH:quinone reductase-like Zn-dependent oxidoreductase